MNTLTRALLKPVIAISFINLLANSAIAQTVNTPTTPSNTSNPTIRNEAAPVPNPAIPYPGITTWNSNYSFPQRGTMATPVIDYGSYYYAPFLPWMGELLGQIVNYEDYFWQLDEYTMTGGGAAPLLAVTMTSNPQNYQSFSSVMSNELQDTTTALQAILNLPPNSPPATVQGSTLALLPGTDTAFPCSSVSCTPPTNEQFNIDTLMGADYYPNSQQTSVTQLIAFLSGAALPPPPLILSTNSSTRNDQLHSASVQSYILNLRTLAAAQSTALSNLNFLAEERNLVKNLGTSSGAYNLYTGQAINGDASQLQVQDFIANRRVANFDNWYTAVNNAPPSGVEREQVYILAEMEAQLFQIRMLNERMLATMSALQVTTSQLSKSMMSMNATNANNTNNSSSSGGSTP